MARPDCRCATIPSGYHNIEDRQKHTHMKTKFPMILAATIILAGRMPAPRGPGILPGASKQKLLPIPHSSAP
jgi:hypothetical protein